MQVQAVSRRRGESGVFSALEDSHASMFLSSAWSPHSAVCSLFFDYTHRAWMSSQWCPLRLWSASLLPFFAAKILGARLAELTRDMMLLRSARGKQRKHSREVSLELAKVRKKLMKVNQLCGDDLSAAAFQALMSAIRSSADRYGPLVRWTTI